MLNQRTINLITISKILKSAGMGLLLLGSVASARSVQTIHSEAQLALILCRNPTDEPTNQLLLDKNAQLVNVTLWNALLKCASSAQRQQLPAKSIEIFKVALHVADLLKQPELVATTYYYLGQTYSLSNDVENSIQAYETSRRLFEKAGIQSNLIYVLADLGAMYVTTEDYEKAQSYSEQSLAIAEQSKSSSIQLWPGSIEYSQARALHTLGEIDLHHGNHEGGLKRLGEALAWYERLNSTSSSYNIQIADGLIALAKGYGEMGQYGRAFSHLTKAHQVSMSSGDQNTRANIMSSQASLFLDQEDYAAAQKHFKASLAIYGSLGNTRQEARVLLNLAIIEERQGHYENALPLFNAVWNAQRLRSWWMSKLRLEQA